MAQLSPANIYLFTLKVHNNNLLSTQLYVFAGQLFRQFRILQKF